jgi:hypothetical protein
MSASLRNVSCFALHPERAGKHTHTHTATSATRSSSAVRSAHAHSMRCADRWAHQAVVQHACRQHRICSHVHAGAAPSVFADVRASAGDGRAACRRSCCGAERRRRWRHSSARRAPLYVSRCDARFAPSDGTQPACTPAPRHAWRARVMRTCSSSAETCAGREGSNATAGTHPHGDAARDEPRGEYKRMWRKGFVNLLGQGAARASRRGPCGEAHSPARCHPPARRRRRRAHDGRSHHAC